MFQSITFYVGEKTLGIYGEEFPLGALTTEVLNITPEEYQALDVRLKAAIEGMALYEKTHKLTDWHRANEQMLLLNEALCHHHIFSLDSDGRIHSGRGKAAHGNADCRGRST